MTRSVDPIAVALKVTRALDALGIIHTIGGSIASSIAGEPRSTLDIDIVAALHESHIAALVDTLSTEFYVDDEALQRAVRQRSSANVIHQATQLKVDIFVAGGTRWTSNSCVAVRPLRSLTGRSSTCIRRKTSSCRNCAGIVNGGAGSERQWRDNLGIIRVQARGLDRDYLRTYAPALDVADLLERAFREATRYAQ